MALLAATIGSGLIPAMPGKAIAAKCNRHFVISRLIKSGSSY
jgi:hypothetical protein